ncbi:MAG: hypothetical protein HOP20_00455 [Sulfuriferula sp.]|nr:hypothetical protein [Sulfuriferula sp.]
MNSLQISLIVLAIVVLAAILFYNWYQEHKYRKQSQAMFKAREDVLFEPHSATDNPPVERIEPSVAPVLSEADMPSSIAPISEPVPAVPAPTLPAAPTDAQLEYAITIHTVDAIPSVVFAPLLAHEQDDVKPVRWLGYVDNLAMWVEISPWREQTYTDIVVAVQLADRAGAVSEAQLSAVTQTAHELASRFNGIASAPDVTAALSDAAALDQFCVEVDVLIGLNIVSHDGRSFAGVNIADAAQQAGLTLNSAGVYQRRNEADEVVYALCNHENMPFSSDVMANLQTHGITLMFEVPRVADGVLAFAELAQFAQQLAQHLDGKLVDDNIRPLSPAGLEKIQTHLTQIYQRMENQGIPAGGRRALRLFN